jgi:hypothetical protein
MFSYFKEPAYCVPKQCKRVPFSSASSPAFVIGGVLDDSHSNRDEMEFWCGFYLHFLYGQG